MMTQGNEDAWRKDKQAYGMQIPQSATRGPPEPSYQGLGDDGSRRRPGKDLNLTRGVDQHKPAGSGEETEHADTDDQQEATLLQTTTKLFPQ